ncbi:hypothetical protein O6H91_12G087400 [Diphasiastrum complanatum]|uniref:Uncharacterized protein n=1 Tax=Diphasiastrum complanatum TaxID=34168 RepID=A0ACC2C4K1_DIPCM|nr:hypothetical protein O6H91_12G087400 [Diphasiastrum complanatum]
MKAVDVAFVKYEEGDGFGHLMAWASLFPVLITAGLIWHIMFKRELQAIFLFLGMLIAGTVNNKIKDHVKEPRPPTCEILDMCDSHGWPSNHSQFMAFFSVFITLNSLFRWHFSSSFNKAFTILFPWSCGVATMYSRIYLGYHSKSQVVAGFSAGLMMGSIWFLLINYVVAPLFPWIEQTGLGRALYIRDSSHIPNVLLFEYNNARAARKAANLPKKAKD